MNRERIRKAPGTVAPNMPSYEEACASFSWERARLALDGLPDGKGLNIACSRLGWSRAPTRPGSPVGRPWRSGLEMTVIGIVSALVGYAVGVLFKVPAP
jgi:hypothetical protein